MPVDDSSDFGVRVSHLDGMTVVTLTGEWDVFARDTLHDALSTNGVKSDVVVDARSASFFDSTALSEFVTFFKRVTEDGRRFELLIGNSNIERLLDMTGLRAMLVPSSDRVAFLERRLRRFTEAG
jgi:anti-anti-sigma factor